jgi:hypothetical protein
MDDRVGRIMISLMAFGFIVLFSTVGYLIITDTETGRIQYNFPPEAKDVASLGNSWYTFTLRDGETNRRFMYKMSGASSVFTELQGR